MQTRVRKLQSNMLVAYHKNATKIVDPRLVAYYFVKGKKPDE